MLHHPRFAALLLAAAASCAQGGEKEPVLASADLVQPALLAGPGFQVEGETRLAGLQARFVIRTEWGELRADSVEMLALRVGEMPQLAALMSADLTEVLGQAGLDELTKPWRSAKALTDEPVERLARLPGGVLRYFTHRLRDWGQRARRLGKRIDERISHEGSPYDGLQLDEAVPKEARPEEPWWDAPVDEVGRLLRSEAGHGRARRAIAQAFGIDPSTSHPLIRQRLDELAWAVASQRLAYDQALGLALPVVAQVIGELQRAESLTRLPDEDSLRLRNEERLGRWTGDPDLRFALAHRSAFPATLMDELLDELDRLAPQGGAEAALEVARMAEGEAEARFVLHALRLLQAPRAERLGAGELVAVGALLGWRDAGGEFFLALPVDHLSWIARVADYFDHAQVARFPRRTVLIAGGVSPRAERQITRRGWSLLAFVRYPGSPPYRDPAEAR
ncbi:hypothetical protein [Pseudomarimonas salicorniae]|uniref:Uncharacterized protein n=1 Tax=Pseudomarimonas salicorniae TaxID=2933270 RepID=A0ABT0GF57_9GAMM|nr:hypothetical protein [Lysobacter sp. CAU 1642]MCK7593182.1 hypothetical protein [Lysobacter sp. CAU 1642]